MSMELFCVGEAPFCELFSMAGAGYKICTEPEEAARIIASRTAKDEIILVSELLLSKHSQALDPLMNDPHRVIVPVPSPSIEKNAADARSTLRKLLGGL